MKMAQINSSQITFVDITDSRKLDVYISSNLPTTQIYNSNTGAYSPDWSTTNLQLTADVYLDSKKITPESIKWYKKTTTSEEWQMDGTTFTIKTNVLSTNPIATYICRVTYQGIQAFNEITFMRADTGLNGSNGADGTSVTILGSYKTISELQAAHPTGSAGDAYIVDGDLYVWAVDDGVWENVGNIQGPAGADGKDAKSIVLSGDSQIFKVSKTNAITPSTIKVTAQAFNTTITNWAYSTNGGQTFLSTVPTGVSRNGNIVTITGSTITSNSIVIKASDGEISDVFTIYKAVDGTDGGKGEDGAPAPIAFLTNENVSFSANSQGQITGTTITSNIVAYSGTTKVTPTVGAISGAPTGMTITPSTITASNEVMLTITISNNATLGSTSSNMGVISIPITYPVSTVLSLTWSKVNAGANGSTGAAGSDAYTVILTNESNTFVGDVSNAIAGSTTTQVLAYRGATAQTVTISSVNGKTASTTDTDTGVAGLKFRCSALSGTSPIITFTCTTAFVSASGSIPIVLSVGDVSFTKMFTYSIAFKGATGATGGTGPAGVPATSYWLMSSASAVQRTSTGTITVTPSTLTFTGKSQTGTATPIDYACRWVIDVSTDGTNYINISTSAANETSKAITVLTTYKTIRARMYMAGGTTTLLDEQIIPVVVDGTSASLVDITPSAYYFKSTTGKDGTFTPDYIYVYPRFQNVTFSKWEYSVDGGTTWVAASGANGLTISTYSSVANTLRIAKTSTLYTDTVTSISFRCVSSNTAVYDTVSIAKIYDVVDLQIGGRNLLLKSGTPVTNSLYNIKNYTLSIPPIIGDQYTITIKGTLGEGKTSFSAYNSGGSVSFGALKRIGTSDLYSLTFTWSNGGRTGLDTAVHIYTMTNAVTVESTIEWIKLEKGNKATDWTPAPEDVDAQIEIIDTKVIDGFAEVKTTTDSIISKANATEQTVATINGDLSSLTTRVSNAEQKITPTAIVSTVRQSTDYVNDLGKKVGNTEIISKINQTAESITISANKIGLLGATNIPDLTADKIKGGTLTLGGSSSTTQNGQLLVKNASNVDVLKVNKDGIIAKSGHLAVAKDFANQTYDWNTGIWTTTTNTSQLDLGDDYIQMGVYSSSGYSNTMRLLDDGLRFQGIAQGIGSWGSFVGHDSLGDFVIDDERGNILLNSAGLTIGGPISGGVASGNAKLLTNVLCKNFASQPIGYLAIRLGSTNITLNSMITIKGNITSYNNSTSFSASCYYYGDQGVFYAPIVDISNPVSAREVYFAEKNGYVYLILGAPSEVWYYPTISVESVSIGYAGHTSEHWSYNWDVETVANLSSFTRVAQCSRIALNQTIWSGTTQASTITLSESYKNFRFLTCVLGDPSTLWGITLGAYWDDALSELHFGAIFTDGSTGTAGNNFYGANFKINSPTSLTLVKCGTKNGVAGSYLRKIVGWR